MCIISKIKLDLKIKDDLFFACLLFLGKITCFAKQQNHLVGKLIWPSYVVGKNFYVNLTRTI